MSLTCREWWTLIHGVGFGGLFLLSFTGVLVDLYALQNQLLTPAGLAHRTQRLKIGSVAMAAAAWGTVVSGTWVIYPWYRSLSLNSPSSILLGDESTKQWHEFGMEWKEHVAWLSPILATVVAFIVLYYGAQLSRHHGARRVTAALFELSFLFAVIAGLLGALITKAAAIR